MADSDDTLIDKIRAGIKRVSEMPPEAQPIYPPGVLYPVDWIDVDSPEGRAWLAEHED